MQKIYFLIALTFFILGFSTFNSVTFADCSYEGTHMIVLPNAGPCKPDQIACLGSGTQCNLQHNKKICPNDPADACLYEDN